MEFAAELTVFCRENVRLSLTEGHAVHAENSPKRERKREKDVNMAGLTTFQGRSVEVCVRLIQMYVSIVVKGHTEPKNELKRLIDLGWQLRRGRNQHL